MSKLDELLKEWHDPLSVHDLQDAEDIIHKLEVRIAGKNAIIKVLREDIAYYKKAIQHTLDSGKYMAVEWPKVSKYLESALKNPAPERKRG